MPKFPTYPDCFDECKQITITSLKLMGYLRPNATVSGPYHWTRGGEPSGSIGITVSSPERYAELNYFSNGKPVNYRVQLERIPAHFGGYNWYFICPATGKRCRNLYGIGERFLSRFAYPSAMYSKQTESKTWRELHKAWNCLELQSEFQAKRHSRTTYNGKLTKRFRRILDKESRFDPNSIRHFLTVNTRSSNKKNLRFS